MTSTSHEVIEEVSKWTVGFGILTFALAPLALPILALTAAALLPLVVLLLAVAAVAALLAAPILLIRAVVRKVSGAASQSDTEPRRDLLIQGR